ncbi:unnamed protein product [Dibothriocephalus latus]|uniref:Uncharacterized protein n=1 Tax=Dibothriocephalus latus TaxID=60516 RepID=A0A3P7P2N4_DIBLA|nr:unnamed protein product [Dibothriocephalus latus]
MSCCGGGQVDEAEDPTASASFSAMAGATDFDGTERCANSSHKLLPLSIAALVGGDHCEEISAQN